VPLQAGRESSIQSPDMISVEVVYATEMFVETIPLDMEDGSTVCDAIDQSDIIHAHTDIDLSKNKVGIFSKFCGLDKVLEDGDRVEIYRPLKADPKVARRMRAERQKTE
jgi:putative ubiquitin-RnfH superfamily antitoxin RatB of RatAB toxin-antitoxin module